MLVMHYRIALSGDPADAAAAIRRRVAQRGHLFDGMPGLERKFFLLDPERPTYATLYLWREPGAALAFLRGPFFAAVIESFGRPEVRLLLLDGDRVAAGAAEGSGPERSRGRGRVRPAYRGHRPA